MTGELPSFIGRKFDQVCFVVEDLDEAIDFWVRANGVDRWDVVNGLATHQTEKEYWGKPADFNFSCAYGFSGDVLIELAKPEGGPNLYQDWLDQGERGAHHIGFLLDDANEYDRAADVYASAGLTKAMAGFFESENGTCRWSYWDTRKFIGCFTELYWVDGQARRQMAKFKSGESSTLIAA